MTSKVAFGIKGKFVIAWYCDKAPNLPNLGPVFKDNVGKSCLEFLSGPKKDSYYNKCYNDRARKAHNDKRGLHEARALTLNKAASAEIQRMLNVMTRENAVEMPSSSKRPTAFRNCGQNIFKTTSSWSAFLTNGATDDWYAGNSDYNFNTNRAMNSNV